MISYKTDKNTIKVETENSIVIIKEGLFDIKGRPVTSVQILPDHFAGERKNIRVGGCSNIRVITLKKKN